MSIVLAVLFLAIAVLILAIPIIRPYGWIAVLFAVLALIVALTGGVGIHIGRSERNHNSMAGHYAQVRVNEWRNPKLVT